MSRCASCVKTAKPYLNVPMAKTAATELYETWTAAFALDDPDLYFYFFQITTKNESFRLLKQGDNTNMEAGDWWQISVIAEEFAVPSALEGAVMYQIFPDRFAKSGQADLHDKLQPYWIHSNTHDIPVWQPNERGEVTNNDFFGGNFAGMCEKLDYLHDLGVEVLYLNPIFMAWSTHRYDTYDYARIDPMLALWQAQRGDTEEFVRGAVERFAGVQNVYVAEENDHIEAVALAVPVTCQGRRAAICSVCAGRAACSLRAWWIPCAPAETARRRLCGGSARQPGTINAVGRIKASRKPLPCAACPGRWSATCGARRNSIP